MNGASHIAPRTRVTERPVLVVALLALGIYVLTLCRGAYPGVSASNLAVAAGLMAEDVSAHPIWLLMCRGVAHLPIGDLAVRLNAISAVCGGIATLLLGTLVTRLLYAMARERAGGAATALRSDDGSDAPLSHHGAGVADGLADTFAALRAHNQRAAATAALGGVVAAMAFAFSAAAWSAATRLQFQNFDALLLLVAGHLLLAYNLRGRRLFALILACLCGAGCVESLAFVVAAPLLLILVVRGMLRSSSAHGTGRSHLLLALLVSSIVGACANLLLLQRLAATGATGGAPSLLAVAIGTARYHRAMFGYAMPHVGWIWVVLLAFVPAGLAGLGGWHAFQKRAVGVSLEHVLLTLANVLCLANVAFSPWGLARESGHLPVMAYLAVAATAGYLFAYWRMLATPSDQSRKPRHRRRAAVDYWMGSILAWVPIATVCLVPLGNLSQANGRRGEFADRVARGVLARLGERTWLVSDGLLDRHLLLAARSEGRTLRVINLGRDRNPAQLEQIRTFFNAEPRFVLFRQRLENALPLGVSVFLDAWLRADSAANRALFVIGAPEVWLRSGWRPVPEGFGFGGVHGLDALGESARLVQNPADWERLAAILAPAINLPPPLERVRRALCRQASRAANDGGVLLEDLGRANEAGAAYLAASGLDSRNVCALLNRLGLAAVGDQDEARRKLENEAHDLLARMHPRPPLLSLVRTYGEIRQPGVLAGIGQAWSLLGQSALARSQLDRAMALAPAGLNARHLLANTLAVQGDTVAAARVYRTVVDRSTNNAAAMIGLAAMSLCSGQTTAARHWLVQAREAGVPEPAWAVPHASLLLAEGATNNALAYLREFTASNPSHMEAWALEAAILLRQQALSEVEHQVLPAMHKGALRSDHYLIHLVRAGLLAGKTPVDHPAIRTSLLHALSLRRDLVEVRGDLLLADIRSGDRRALLADVGETLRFDPDHAFANYLAGALLIEQGELPRAEEHFRRSLASRPSAVAFNDLAETLRRLGRLDEAEQLARQAVLHDPRCGQAWDTLARALLDANRVPEAGHAVTQALALRAQDPAIQRTLARVRLAQGRPDEGR